MTSTVCVCVHLHVFVCLCHSSSCTDLLRLQPGQRAFLRFPSGLRRRRQWLDETQRSNPDAGNWPQGRLPWWKSVLNGWFIWNVSVCLVTRPRFTLISFSEHENKSPLPFVSICLQVAFTSTTSVTMCPTDRKLVCWVLPSHPRPPTSASSFDTTCSAQTLTTCWMSWPRGRTVRRRSGGRWVSTLQPGWWAQSPWQHLATTASQWVWVGHYGGCKHRLRAAMQQLVSSLEIQSWRRKSELTMNKWNKWTEQEVMTPAYCQSHDTKEPKTKHFTHRGEGHKCC